MSHIKELEELLDSEKQEVERRKIQHITVEKELAEVQDQNTALESQVSESHCTMKELEEKIISAVKLLISFKQKRDELWVECKNARRRVRDLKNPAPKEVTSLCGPGLLEFSFMEVNEATNDFDPSRKLGEGKSGTVYKGLLRHMLVAIKMLPSYGTQSHLEFQDEVSYLSSLT